MLPQQLFNALVLGSVYALFSMGFTLTFGVLRVINLLYAFYVAAGAFLSLVAVRDFGVPLWAAGVLGAIGTGAIAVVCDTAVLTPLRRARAPELSSLMVTLGGVLLLNNLMFLAFGAEVRRFPAALLSQAPIDLGALQIGEIQLVIIVVVAVARHCAVSVHRAHPARDRDPCAGGKSRRGGADGYQRRRNVRRRVVSRRGADRHCRHSHRA